MLLEMVAGKFKPFEIDGRQLQSAPPTTLGPRKVYFALLNIGLGIASMARCYAMMRLKNEASL